jgi:hypothetical protein
LFVEMLREGRGSMDTLTMDHESRRRLLLQHFGLAP